MRPCPVPAAASRTPYRVSPSCNPPCERGPAASPYETAPHRLKNGLERSRAIPTLVRRSVYLQAMRSCLTNAGRN